jgi:hypothetical protein
MIRQIIRQELYKVKGQQLNLESEAAREMLVTAIADALESKKIDFETDDEIPPEVDDIYFIDIRGN